jgi:hypothetical protein
VTGDTRATMKNETRVDSPGNHSAQAHDQHDVCVFLCYRRKDGAWYADWLRRNLKVVSFPDATGKPRHIHVYSDITAPGVADWKKFHFPSLQTSHAMILVCTPGIAKDLSKRSEPDWVYKELRWWCGHRDIAPIVVDTTGEGDRWLPELIVKKWPNINRIDLDKDNVTAPENVKSDLVTTILDRITGAIRESEQRTVFQDLERFRQLSKRLAIALVFSVLLFLVAASAVVFALRALHTAEEQTRVAQEQKRIVQMKVVQLLFLPNKKDSDDARDAFYTSLDGRTDTAALVWLMDRTIANKTNSFGVINALKILECYGPYKSNIYNDTFGALFDALASSEDSEIKLHLNILRLFVEADQTGKPRQETPGYDRFQWIRDVPRPR